MTFLATILTLPPEMYSGPPVRSLDANALSNGAVVVTNNEADFEDVPGLRIENWTV